MHQLENTSMKVFVNLSYDDKININILTDMQKRM